MSITLTRAGTTLPLDPDLQWADEFEWSRKQQSRAFSLTGSLLIDEAEKLAGRPITLQAVDETAAWMTRAEALQLQEWSGLAGTTFELSINGQAFDVTFRVDDNEPGLSAAPVVFFSNPGAEDNYVLTLRFITV